jgi:hypothetical protein
VAKPRGTIDPESSSGKARHVAKGWQTFVWLDIARSSVDPPFSLIPLPHASYMPCRRRPSLPGTLWYSIHGGPNSPPTAQKVNASLWDIER